jgi:hypothetical protein
MGLMVVPIIPGKVEEWKRWTEKLKGEKKAEFDDLNKRHGITRHDAWLAETPAGSVAVVLHEGTGSDFFMQNVGASKNAFDIWFRESVQGFHGMDLNAPPPGPMPVKVL